MKSKKITKNIWFLMCTLLLHYTATNTSNYVLYLIYLYLSMICLYYGRKVRVCNVRPVCECVRSNYWIILKTFSQTHEKKRKNKLCLLYTNYVLTMYQNIHSQSYYVSLVSLWWIKQPLFVIVQNWSIFLSDFRSTYIRSRYLPKILKRKSFG